MSVIRAAGGEFAVVLDGGNYRHVTTLGVSQRLYHTLVKE